MVNAYKNCWAAPSLPHLAAVPSSIIMDEDECQTVSHWRKLNPGRKRMNFAQQGIWEAQRCATGRVPAARVGPRVKGSMAARVAKLEADIDHIKTDVADTRADVRHIASKVGELATKVDVIEERTMHVATKTWVLSGVIVVLITILSACGWAVQQYLGPILAKLPA
ncbi:hypothetical protein [Luteibacter aegosomatissinici]|uniref:hypothetical protein n=1 Tax=Luteibacter aegosomatissinici TaxID=2911539 RepID=UPI001FFBB3E6|nr:hypothetical protein [Luteibacter aegosomatissinici]UPG93121.1 hypothetical protein L2Y97_14740 [Luteibacter aegosomatissinici]